MRTEELIEACKRCIKGTCGQDCPMWNCDHYDAPLCEDALFEKIKDKIIYLERENAMLEHGTRELDLAAHAKQIIDEFTNSISLMFYQEFEELIPSIMEDKIRKAADYFKERI